MGRKRKRRKISKFFVIWSSFLLLIWMVLIIWHITDKDVKGTFENRGHVPEVEIDVNEDVTDVFVKTPTREPSVILQLDKHNILKAQGYYESALNDPRTHPEIRKRVAREYERMETLAAEASN